MSQLGEEIREVEYIPVEGPLAEPAPATPEVEVEKVPEKV